MRNYLAFIVFTFFSLPVLAVVDGEKYPFDDPTDARRFELLAEDLRCPKCQNQNLADSSAPVAADLREKVYTLMQDGQTDDQIVDYLVARYGDFVRYNPPFRMNTLFLWGGPVVALLLGLLLIVGIRRAQKKPVSDLSDADKARIEALKKEYLVSQSTNKADPS
ncbi:cytochrome c-type biogenesis protein [Thalassolituus sp.]|jgi:cytochrome c-type biogenesis protein CcmH|uniref:cytochrome c-type biogenesis protein n=1 Tax=Thalassolituus sp. TaxID=2030822 RepID=UPI002A8095A2|nr:cytochrome c-type biogenesis protein [Thalassolituus sp.]|tara:strand:- start:437 stop:928 length:492 start_codon:yes stop_codon:yes gene_type:complete